MQSVSAGEVASFQESFLRAVVAAAVSAEIAFKEAEAEAARRLRELLQKEESERLKLEEEERNRTLESGMQISMGDILLFGYASGSKTDTLSGMAGRFYHPGLPKTLDALKDVPEGSALPGAADLRIDFAGQPVLQTDAEGTVVVNKFIGADFEPNYFTSFFKVRSPAPLSEEPRRIIEEMNREKTAVLAPVKEGFRGYDRAKQPAAKPLSHAANPARSVPSPSVAPPLKSARSLQHQTSRSSQHQPSQNQDSRLSRSFQNQQSQSSQNQQSHYQQSQLSQQQQSELSQSFSSQLSQHQPLGSDAKSRYVFFAVEQEGFGAGSKIEVLGQFTRKRFASFAAVCCIQNFARHCQIGTERFFRRTEKNHAFVREGYR